jgi:hypothetical protein
MRGEQFSLFVFVIRVRPSTSTRNDHDFGEAIERNEADKAFSAAC